MLMMTRLFDDSESTIQHRQLEVTKLKSSYKPSNIFRQKYAKARVASLEKIGTQADVDHKKEL